MNFISPLAGAIAAAIAIPALLLLYFLKLRRREQVISSTVLWRKAILDLQVNAPFQKLRRNLLLLLQLLVLAALALALSQPTVPFRPSTGKSTVLLIDRSASMGATDGNEKGITRLAEAKRRADELVGTLGKGAQAMVIAFDDRAEIVQTFTTDPQLLRKAIDAITLTDRRSKLKLAYQLADAQGALRAGGLSEGPSAEAADAIKPPDVWVYSDGRVSDADEISTRSEVRYEPLGSDKSANVGIVALSARRNYENPTEVQVFARLANYGPEPISTDVQLSIDGAVHKVARVHLLPDRWTEAQRQEAEKANPDNAARDAAEFTLALPQSAVVTVEQMYRDGDKFGADDKASVIIPPPKNLSVLLVTDGNDPFLARVMKVLSLRDPGEMTPEAYEANLPTNRDVIVFDNYRPKKLPPTGNFAYFGTLPDGLRLKAKTQEGAVIVNPDMTSVLDWKREHPILRDVPMGKVVAQDVISLEPAPESEVLVEGLQGPLMVLHREGRSIHLALAFDPLKSTWPVGGVGWPIFMHNLMQYFATSSDLSVRETYPPGATPRIPRTALTNVSRLTLTGPNTDAKIDVPADGEVALPALEKVGLYELDPPVAGFERLAVNLLDSNESNILPAGSPPGGVGKTIEAKTSKARLELWWWLVLAGAIPLLLVEWWVYTRRTHL